VLLFQDLAVTPLLIMVSLLANGQSGAIDQAGALWTLAQAALGVALLVIGGRVVLRPLFQSVALAKDHEFFMAASLLVVLGAAVAAQAMGLSMAIGAFVGGILLAETEFRRQIEATIDPFRGLLLGLFFISIGAKLDLALLSQNPGQIITMMLAFVLLKAAVMYALTMRVKIRGVVRHEVAWLLAPGGEFAFVLLASGMASGLVWPTIGSKLLVAVTLSMFFIPVIALVIGRMERIGEHGQEKTFDEIDEDAAEGGVIVIGCGRVGTLVAEMLARHKVPAFCVDTNPRNVAQARSEGLKAYFGDPLVPQFMDRLHLENARALVLTLNNPSAVETILTTARRAHPTLTIVARARDRNHAQKLYELGVTDAVPETFEASLQLSEAVLVDVGVPMGLVIASVHDKRDKTRKRLKTASGEEVKAPQAVRRLKAGE